MAEENVKEVIEAEETPTPNKENKTETKAVSQPQDNGAEKTLRGIATFIMWMGIIVGIFGTIPCTFLALAGNPVGIFIPILIGIFFSALIAWALLKVVADISSTLKEINSKIK